MHGRAIWLMAALALGGCDDEPTAALDGGQLDFDQGLFDVGPVTAWDSGLDGRVQRADQFVLDAAVPSACLEDDGALYEHARSEAIAGALDVRADVDVDGDGVAEIAVLAADETGARFVFLSSSDLGEVGRIELRGATYGTLMPGLWPPQRVVQPVDVGGTPVLGVLERRPDGAGLRVVRPDGMGVRFLEFPRGVRQAVMMNTGGAGWRLLVDEAEGGCAVYGLEAETPLGAWPSCSLRPGWDANADGAIDIVRRTATDVAVLDAWLLEPALLGREPFHLGFVPVTGVEGAPTPGPFDLRGQGPELVGAVLDSGLRVHALEPFDLLPQGDPSNLNGVFTRLEYVLSPAGLRLWAQEDRNGLLYVRVLAPGATLRRRGELGPFRALQWGVGADVDGDGYREMWMLGGSDPDGTNTAVRTLRADDGGEAFVVPAERSARFSVAWAASDHGPRTFDLDGCEGDERVVVRSGNGRAGGPTPTRLQVLDLQGESVFRGEAIETWVHRAAVADLDGDGRAEVFELVGEQMGEASVVRWSATPTE